MFFPFLAAIAGWCLTEFGRQPWIVQGLQKTADANSPSVSSTWIGISLGVLVCLYIALLSVDFWLMRRYARRDPVGFPSEEASEAPPVPAY
jgi:cytochrome d ubiquinol oxidase subunit I